MTQTNTKIIGYEPKPKNGLFKSERPELRVKPIFDKIMTAKNTTQNKEELSEELKDNIICETGSEPDGKFLRIKTTDELITILTPILNKSISQAHQSGIEEGARAERVKIAKLLGDEYENMENNASFYLKLAALKENK